MTALLLSEDQQAALRAVIGADTVPGVDLPGEQVLQHLARLLPCDDMGIASFDDAGRVVAPAIAGPGVPGEDALSATAGPARLGIQHRHRLAPDGGAGRRGAAAVLSLGVRIGAAHVVILWLVRRRSDFSAHDRALLGLVAPALERVLRAPQPASLAVLTGQERRVLHHVAAGLSNGEIAERLVVAPCTVRKHLENAYRKLGVSNRLAAVHALTGSAPVFAPAQRAPEDGLATGQPAAVGPSAAPRVLSGRTVPP